MNYNNIQIQKSRTCQENDYFQRQSLTIRLNNIGRTRLETVLETVSEASNSNSKILSSEISDDNENKDNKENKETNEHTGKIETKESGRNKESGDYYPEQNK